MTNQISFTNGAVGGSLIRLAMPILCVSMLQSLNGTVSAFWIGRCLGEAALTALTNAQSLMFLLTGGAYGIAMAATVRVGQCIGANDVQGAKRVIGTGIVFFLLLSVVLTLLGLEFVEFFLKGMKTSPEALLMAIPYLKWMLLALPTMYLFAFLMSLLIGAGDADTPLKFVLLSVLFGAILTPAFVLGVGAVAGVGVTGAALANFSAQAICLVALLRHLYRSGHPLRLTRLDAANLRVDWSIVWELVRKGIPMGAQILTISLSSVLMISLVNRYGVETSAAYSVLLQLWTYIMMPAVAMAAAVSAMAAQNVGARNWKRVSNTAWVGIGYSFAVTGSIVAMVYASNSSVYRLFLPPGSAALTIATHVNSIVTWSFVFMSIPLVLFGVMRAAGAVFIPLLVHVLSLFVVRYPMAVLLLDRWQADAIWWSFSTSVIVDAVLSTLYYRYGGWKPADRSLLREPS